MTLDDLIKIGEDAWSESYDSMEYDESKEADKADRARYRAVVLALRDETQRHVIDAYSMDRMFDDILGDAGNEKAAGGPTSNAGLDVETVKTGPHSTTPAADPSPQCEWTPRKNKGWFEPSCDFHRRHETAAQYGTCPSCGRNIKFKEPT